MSMNIDISRRNKTPRPLSDDERARLEEFIDSIHYSARYDCKAIRRCEAPECFVTN